MAEAPQSNLVDPMSCSAASAPLAVHALELDAVWQRLTDHGSLYRWGHNQLVTWPPNNVMLHIPAHTHRVLTGKVCRAQYTTCTPGANKCRTIIEGENLEIGWAERWAAKQGVLWRRTRGINQALLRRRGGRRQCRHCVDTTGQLLIIRYLRCSWSVQTALQKTQSIRAHHPACFALMMACTSVRRGLHVRKQECRRP